MKNEEIVQQQALQPSAVVAGVDVTKVKKSSAIQEESRPMANSKSKSTTTTTTESEPMDDTTTGAIATAALAAVAANKQDNNNNNNNTESETIMTDQVINEPTNVYDDNDNDIDPMEAYLAEAAAAGAASTEKLQPLEERVSSNITITKGQLNKFRYTGLGWTTDHTNKGATPYDWPTKIIPGLNGAIDLRGGAEEVVTRIQCYIQPVGKIARRKELRAQGQEPRWQVQMELQIALVGGQLGSLMRDGTLRPHWALDPSFIQAKEWVSLHGRALEVYLKAPFRPFDKTNAEEMAEALRPYLQMRDVGLACGFVARERPQLTKPGPDSERQDIFYIEAPAPTYGGSRNIAAEILERQANGLRLDSFTLSVTPMSNWRKKETEDAPSVPGPMIDDGKGEGPTERHVEFLDPMAEMEWNTRYINFRRAFPEKNPLNPTRDLSPFQLGTAITGIDRTYPKRATVSEVTFTPPKPKGFDDINGVWAPKPVTIPFFPPRPTDAPAG